MACNMMEMERKSLLDLGCLICGNSYVKGGFISDFTEAEDRGKDFRGRCKVNGKSRTKGIFHNPNVIL